MLGLQAAQDLRQVRRADLGGSTRAVGELREPAGGVGVDHGAKL
jgi:hypothetical protein